MKLVPPQPSAAAPAGKTAGGKRMRAKALAAFDAQYGRLLARALRFARRKVGNATCEDVVQEAFMMLWQVAYDDGKDVPAEPTDRLFYRILRRRVVDAKRGTKRRDELDDQQVLDIAGYLERTTDTALVAEGAMIRKRVDYLAETLPPKTAKAYRLHEEGHTPAEIAESLGMSLATARWHVAEAVGLIRRQLIKDGYEIRAPRPRGRHRGPQE